MRLIELILFHVYFLLETSAKKPSISSDNSDHKLPQTLTFVFQLVYIIIYNLFTERIKTNLIPHNQNGDHQLFIIRYLLIVFVNSKELLWLLKEAYKKSVQSIIIIIVIFISKEDNFPNLCDKDIYKEVK